MNTKYKQTVKFESVPHDKEVTSLDIVKLVKQIRFYRSRAKEAAKMFGDVKLLQKDKQTISSLRAKLVEALKYRKQATITRIYRSGLEASCTTNISWQWDDESSISASRKEIRKNILSSIRYEVQAARREQRKCTNSVSKFGVSSTKNGLVYTKEGYFLKLSKAKLTSKVFDDKKPLSLKNHIGVEIEFYIPNGVNQDDLAIQFAEAGLSDYVSLKDDGSIRCDDDDSSHEVAVVAPETEIQSIIQRVCNVLSDNNAQVNSSCGLHVHIDLRNRSAQMIYNRLVNAQGHLFKLIPSSRRSNEYCQRIKPGYNIEHFDGGSRYYAINPASYKKYKTVEVRLHSGTTDSEKINNWIALLLSITKHGIIKGELTIPQWLKALGVTKTIANYYIERSKKFGTWSEDDEHNELPDNNEDYDDEECCHCGDSSCNNS